MKNMKSKKYKLIRDKHKVLTLNPMPNEIELDNLYKKKYYQKNYGTYKISKYVVVYYQNVLKMLRVLMNIIIYYIEQKILEII